MLLIQNLNLLPTSRPGHTLCSVS